MILYVSFDQKDQYDWQIYNDQILPVPQPTPMPYNYPDTNQNTIVQSTQSPSVFTYFHYDPNQLNTNPSPFNPYSYQDLQPIQPVNQNSHLSLYDYANISPLKNIYF